MVKYENPHDRAYLNHIQGIIESGKGRDDRTKNGTTSIFGTLTTFDLREGFPLLTTKKMGIKSIIKELIWFLKGSTNIRSLVNQNVHIWDKDAYRFYTDRVFPNLLPSFKLGATLPLTMEDFLGSLNDLPCQMLYKSGNKDVAYNYGDLGRVYGYQWNKQASLDGGLPVGQIDRVVRELISNPDSRRLLTVSWDANDMWSPDTALPCCHYAFQFYVDGEYIDMMYQMRSNDTFLGMPYNIASYAVLLHMVCVLAGKKPRFLKQSTGDAHIYNGHQEVICEQLGRSLEHVAPDLVVHSRGQEKLSDFTLEDFHLFGYTSHPAIYAEMYT